MERRFGTIAVEMGFITLDQLVEALNIQVIDNVKKKTHRVIGTILFEEGLITVEQIDEVVKALGKERGKSGGLY